MSSTSDTMTENRRQKKWAQPFASLRYRSYLFFWLSSWTEHGGQFMELAAVLWLVHKMTGSPLILTIVAISRHLPPVVLGFFGGVLADRVDRRKLLVSTLAWMAFLSAILTALVMTGLVQVWHIVLISLLQSSAQSFNHPARQSIIPNLVGREHLMNVIALNNLSVMGSRVVGMVLAGYLLASVGVAPVVAARTVGAFMGIIFLLLADVPPTPSSARKTTAWRNMVEGVDYIRDNRIILSLSSMFIIIQFASLTATSLMPPFAEEILGLGAEGYGWLAGTMATGSLAATLVLASLHGFSRKGWLLTGSGILLGAAFFGFSQSQWVFLSLLCLLFAGCTNSMFRGVNTTIMQERIPDDMRGRVMSLRDISIGLGSAAALLSGGLGEWVGVRFAMGTLGVMVFTAILITCVLRTKIREIE